MSLYRPLHKWFAWYPVYANSTNELVWLKTVNRKRWSDGKYTHWTIPK